MKMAMKEGKIMIIEADSVQSAIIKSWGKMVWSRREQMYVGEISRELLERLAILVRLPPSIEKVRQEMNAVQNAVDHERSMKDPKPLMDYPVKGSLYEHQVRAANMALLTFEIVSPKEVSDENPETELERLAPGILQNEPLL